MTVCFGHLVSSCSFAFAAKAVVSLGHQVALQTANHLQPQLSETATHFEKLATTMISSLHCSVVSGQRQHRQALQQSLPHCCSSGMDCSPLA